MIFELETLFWFWKYKLSTLNLLNWTKLIWGNPFRHKIFNCWRRRFLFMYFNASIHVFRTDRPSINLAVQTFSLIDNILVNHLENFRAGLLSSDVSDHIPIFLIYEFILSINTSIAHRIRNPLRRTSEHIAIIYFQIFT